MNARELRNLLGGIIVPRPIAFVSTVGEDGVFNLAPFSFFAPLCHRPMLVGFCVSRKKGGELKDTLKNIQDTGEFVLNLVTEALAVPMSQSSKAYPSYVDEFKEVGLTPARTDLVKAPMVAESPVNAECRLVQILEFGETDRKTSFIVGEVLRIHVEDELYVDGEIQLAKLKAVGRMGTEHYCYTRDIFEMRRPDALE
ncbi:flavin reductase family protein [Chloroflexota bacterium]